MNAKSSSLVVLALAVTGMLYLVFKEKLFAHRPLAIAVQVLSCSLMVWARITFGSRSFHAAADPTAGGLVTHGPYRFWRHPIYAAIVYFVWAGVLSAPTLDSVGVAAAITGCLVVRMLLEEQLLRRHFPDYEAYSARTKRLIPFVF